MHWIGLHYPPSSGTIHLEWSTLSDVHSASLHQLSYNAQANTFYKTALKKEAPSLQTKKGGNLLASLVSERCMYLLILNGINPQPSVVCIVMVCLLVTDV